jgi:hypothetical protein
MSYSNGIDEEVGDDLAHGLGVTDVLEITFHRSYRVADHERSIIQPVTKQVHHSKPFNLTGWPPNKDFKEEEYLLATERMFQLGSPSLPLLSYE